jgi:hypothetical protein
MLGVVAGDSYGVGEDVLSLYIKKEKKSLTDTILHEFDTSSEYFIRI